MESNKNIWYIGLGIAAVAAIVFWLLRDTVIIRPLLYALLSVGSVFIILLVLIQRGRGGGLAGALGGMGGYSAFGTRAGDIFTRITIVAAAIWLLAAMALTKITSRSSRSPYELDGPATSSSQTPGAGAIDAGKESDESSSKETSPSPSEGTQPIDKKTNTETDSRSQ